MSKTYKGYELYKMIAEGEIKEGTKFKSNNGTIWFWDRLNFQASENYSCADIVFATMDFELLE